jgi:hypothetical protein
VSPGVDTLQQGPITQGRRGGSQIRSRGGADPGALLVAIPAQAGSDPANSCKNGGHVEYVDPSTGEPFKNQGQCVSFVRGGGTLVSVGEETSPEDGGEIDVSNADIVFVSPRRDYPSEEWWYQVGLLGFPVDTVVEVSGSDAYGNPRVAPVVMTTAEGSGTRSPPAS